MKLKIKYLTDTETSAVDGHRQPHVSIKSEVSTWGGATSAKKGVQLGIHIWKEKISKLPITGSLDLCVGPSY